MSATTFSNRFQRWLDKRIPPQSKITLNQRSIFILPSKTGVAFCGLLALLLLLSINYQNSLIYGLTFILTSVLLVTILHTFKNLSGVSFELIKTSNSFVDEEVEIQIRLSGHANSSHFNILLGWPNSVKQCADLTPSEASIVSIFLPARQRGWLRPDRILVETFYPLGLIRAWTWIDFDIHALIYPKPIFGDTLSTNATSLATGNHKEVSGNDDFAQMRSYQEGDPLKHVAWRSYARTDQLLVKQFSSKQSTDVIVDWQQVQGDTEIKLSRLTGLALTAQRANIKYGLKLPHKEILPNDGHEHLNTILKELALYAS